jgi:hypothetical protein
VQADRWECGSEFHWPTHDPPNAPFRPSGRADATWWGSGRDAMRALMRFLRQLGTLRRLWVPSFFCQSVIGSLASEGLPLLCYPDRPTVAEPALDALNFRTGDGVLVCNYFGLRAAPESYPDGLTVIEDHTHDPFSPWADVSRADYALCSLRKTLPLPDGGLLWSPIGKASPSAEPASKRRLLASGRKLAAALLKAQYLQGADVSKDVFRGLSMAGEEEIADGDVSGMTPWSRELLRTLPIPTWWRQRRSNHAAFAAGLAHMKTVELLAPHAREASPSTAYIVFDTPERRDATRHHLIRHNVFPAVLWSLESPAVQSIDDEAIRLSRRGLSLHCDHRYDADDINQVVRILEHALS